MKSNRIYLAVPILVVVILVIYFINQEAGRDDREGPGYEIPGLETVPREETEEERKETSQAESETPVREKEAEEVPVSSPPSPKPTEKMTLEQLDTEPEAPLRVVNPRPITPKQNFISPRWSPDGLDVICSKDKYRGLYLVSSDGSEIRELSDEFGIGFDVKWSPDGTKLIVRKGDQTKVIDISGEMEDVSSEELDLPEDRFYAEKDNIFLKNPDSGENQSLTDGEDAYFNPEMSPVGDKVAFEGLTSGVHIKDLKTGEMIDLGQGTNVMWTPDGEGVIYSFTQDDGMDIIAGDIYFAYADGSGVFNISNTPDVIELNPSISPDGSQVTYEVDGQVFVADLEEMMR